MSYDTCDIFSSGPFNYFLQFTLTVQLFKLAGEVLIEKRIKSDSTNINDIGGAMPTSKRGRTIKTSDKR